MAVPSSSRISRVIARKSRSMGYYAKLMHGIWHVLPSRRLPFKGSHCNNSQRLLKGCFEYLLVMSRPCLSWTPKPKGDRCCEQNRQCGAFHWRTGLAEPLDAMGNLRGGWAPDVPAVKGRVGLALPLALMGGKWLALPFMLKGSMGVG